MGFWSTIKRFFTTQKIEPKTFCSAKPKSNHGEPYTKEDDHFIMLRIVNDSEIAKHLGRTPGAIKQRRRKINSRK